MAIPVYSTSRSPTSLLRQNRVHFMAPKEKHRYGFTGSQMAKFHSSGLEDQSLPSTPNTPSVMQSSTPAQGGPAQQPANTQDQQSDVTMQDTNDVADQPQLTNTDIDIPPRLSPLAAASLPTLSAADDTPQPPQESPQSLTEPIKWPKDLSAKTAVLLGVAPSEPPLETLLPKLSIDSSVQQPIRPAKVESSVATITPALLTSTLQPIAGLLQSVPLQSQASGQSSVGPGERALLRDISQPGGSSTQQWVVEAEEFEETELKQPSQQQSVDQLAENAQPVEQPVERPQLAQEHLNVPTPPPPPPRFNPLPTLQPAYAALPPHALAKGTHEDFHSEIKAFLRRKTQLHLLEYVSAAKRQAVHDNAHDYAAVFVEEKGLDVWPARRVRKGRGGGKVWGKVRSDEEWSVVVDAVAEYIRVLATIVAPDNIADAVQEEEQIDEPGSWAWRKLNDPPREEGDAAPAQQSSASADLSRDAEHDDEPDTGNSAIDAQVALTAALANLNLFHTTPPPSVAFDLQLMTSRFIFANLPPGFYLDVLGPDNAEAVEWLIPQLGIQSIAAHSAWMWPGLSAQDLGAMVPLVEAYVRAVAGIEANSADEGEELSVLSARVQQAVENSRAAAPAGVQNRGAGDHDMPALLSDDTDDHDMSPAATAAALTAAFTNLDIFPSAPPPKAAHDFQQMATLHLFAHLPASCRLDVLGPEVAASLNHLIDSLAMDFISDHSPWLWPGRSDQDLERDVLPLVTRYIRLLVRVEAVRGQLEADGVWMPESRVKMAVEMERNKAEARRAEEEKEKEKEKRETDTTAKDEKEGKGNVSAEDVKW